MENLDAFGYENETKIACKRFLIHRYAWSRHLSAYKEYAIICMHCFCSFNLQVDLIGELPIAFKFVIILLAIGYMCICLFLNQTYITLAFSICKLLFDY